MSTGNGTGGTGAQGGTGGTRGAAGAGNDTEERDPYAPPPEGAPDRPPSAPWNLPGAGSNSGAGRSGTGGSGPDNSGGSGGGPWGDPDSHRDHRGRDRDDDRPPADPRRRNARFALWLGVWGLFFGIFLWEEAGIVMGFAAAVLGFRALRGTSAPVVGPRIEQGPGGTARTPGRARRFPRPARVRTAPGARTPGTAPRPQGALVGLVTGVLAVVWVLGVWSFRWSQQDYYDCMDAALTKQAQQQCKSELPEFARDLVDNLDNNPI